MPDELTENLRERLTGELAEDGQGRRDAQMPAPPDPNPGGGAGPSPSDAAITGAAERERDPAKTPEVEDPDPGVANAGGVDAPNTDGMTRSTGRD